MSVTVSRDPVCSVLGCTDDAEYRGVHPEKGRRVVCPDHTGPLEEVEPL